MTIINNRMILIFNINGIWYDTKLDLLSLCTLLVNQKNVGQAGGKPRLDLNVEEAWALGYTGKNITTAIMDDGVDYTHPDLMHNYVSENKNTIQR